MTCYRRPPRPLPYERAEVFEAWAGWCIYCPSPATELDHLTPLSRGGQDERTNVAPVCRGCNASKSNLTLIEWALT